MPQRAAIAVRWISALVEPPTACSTVNALVNAEADMIERGTMRSRARATARAPAASLARRRAECTAGIAALPGIAMPIASVTSAIVDAVPMTMQVPTVGASFALISSISAAPTSPPRNLPQ